MRTLWKWFENVVVKLLPLFHHIWSNFKPSNSFVQLYCRITISLSDNVTTKLSVGQQSCRITTMHIMVLSACIESYICWLFFMNLGVRPTPPRPKISRKLKKIIYVQNTMKVTFFDFSWFLGGPTPHPPPNF